MEPIFNNGSSFNVFDTSLHFIHFPSTVIVRSSQKVISFFLPVLFRLRRGGEPVLFQQSKKSMSPSIRQDICKNIRWESAAQFVPVIMPPGGGGWRTRCDREEMDEIRIEQEDAAMLYICYSCCFYAYIEHICMKHETHEFLKPSFLFLSLFYKNVPTTSQSAKWSQYWNDWGSPKVPRHAKTPKCLMPFLFRRRMSNKPIQTTT